MDANLKTSAEWHELVNRRAALTVANLPAMREKMGVTVEASTIAAWL